LSDFLEFFGQRIGRYRPKQRPTMRDTLVFLGFKLNYFVLALGLPLWLHSWSNVLVVAFGIQLIVGFTIALVFQLAHVVDAVEMPEVDAGTRRLEEDWATHQLRTTADFAADNRFVSWYCGGLNMQVEHHLFSRISHVRYQHLRPVVEAACREYGVRYRSYPSVLSAVRGHLRRLSALAQPPLAAASAASAPSASEHAAVQLAGPSARSAP
jgi:linoleoyl-CoA desaturase